MPFGPPVLASMSYGRIHLLLAAFTFSYLCLQQGSYADSPPPDSGNFTTSSIQCGDVKIIRQNAECPHPLNVMIKFVPLENYTTSLSFKLTPIITVHYKGQEVHLYPDQPTDSQFNGTFNLITNMSNPNCKGFTTTLSVKHGDGISFNVTFLIQPDLCFANKVNTFGPFRIDDSSLKFQSVCFINTTKEAIVTMVTANFTNCTNQSLINFSLPLILELSNGSQYDLQNRSRTCNDTISRKNAPVALNVSINHACLDSTTVETKLTLQHFPETFGNMCSAIICAELSESTARSDVCKNITWNKVGAQINSADGDSCPVAESEVVTVAPSPTQHPSTPDVGTIVAVVISVAVPVLLCLIIVLIVACCLYIKLKPSTGTYNCDVSAERSTDIQELQDRIKPTAASLQPTAGSKLVPGTKVTSVTKLPKTARGRNINARQRAGVLQDLTFKFK